ncbi:hypothetical protein K7432_003705 [Basidiobolus ranarum]|uniref:Uncharacterized protein n=1 Tax=Basidiobolus ranarum TaxID=34480 RepID=A0ABR2WZI6_9FUNG
MQSKDPFLSFVDFANGRGKGSMTRCKTPDNADTRIKIYDHSTHMNSLHPQHSTYINEGFEPESIEHLKYKVQHYEAQVMEAQKTISAQMELMNATTNQLLAKEQEFNELKADWQKQVKGAAKDLQIKELERQLADIYAQLAISTGRSITDILKISSENQFVDLKSHKRAKTEPITYHLTNGVLSRIRSSSSPTPTSTTANHTSKRQCNYSKWTSEEDNLLKYAVTLHGVHKWSVVATHVPNRTPMQCSARWLGALNTSVVKGRWTSEEDKLLSEAVHEYVVDEKYENLAVIVPWNKIALVIPNRTGIQCQARWTEALDPTVRKGRWTLEEDEQLCIGVKKYGRCWIRIAQGIPGRTQRQCRTRWVQVKEKAGFTMDSNPES